MTYERMTIVLDKTEADALRENAKANLRRPADQARYLLRAVLLGHGEKTPETRAPNCGQNADDPARLEMRKEVSA